MMFDTAADASEGDFVAVGGSKTTADDDDDEEDDKNDDELESTTAEGDCDAKVDADGDADDGKVEDAVLYSIRSVILLNNVVVVKLLELVILDGGAFVVVFG